MTRQPNDQNITALYERLSRDDEFQGPSNSIKNQQTMLEDYARNNGLGNLVHYTDDGISGTRFDRPGFVRMMDDIEAGKIGTILCKDTSRLGRDHLRVGLFMETLRQKGVRLISLGDNVDTAKGEDDFLPFRNIIHEWYARDTSRKIKAIYKSKGMNGKHTSIHPLYGYMKSAEDKEQWVVDPEAAAVVKRVFRMTLEGCGPYQIASTLSAEKVPCPSYYLAQKGKGNYKNRVFQDPYRWWGTTITYLLERVEYMGHMVNFKTFKSHFKDKHRQVTPMEERVVFENKHEAIIDSETWQIANRIRQKAKRRRTNSFGEANPLTGLLYCVDCGAKLYNERSLTRQGKPRDQYVCASYRKQTTECTAHTVKTSVVRELVLDTLRVVNSYVRESEVEFIRQINELFSTQQAGAVKAQRKKLAEGQKRMAELDKLIQRSYEDNVAGRISDKRFEVFSAAYEEEQAELEQTTMRMQADIDSFDDSATRAEKFLALTRRYREFDELTASMLHEFVDKIIIHERAKKWVHHTTQKIEVYLNFIGTFMPPVAESDVVPDPAALAEQAQREKKRQYARDYQRKRHANGGKPLTPPDTRTPEQIAAAEVARKEKWKNYNREYQREYQRKLARQRREAKAALVEQ